MKRRKAAVRLAFEPEKDGRRRVLLNGYHTAWKVRRGKDVAGRRIWELVKDEPGDPPVEGKVWGASAEARSLLRWLRAVLVRANARSSARDAEGDGARAARDVSEC